MIPASSVTFVSDFSNMLQCIGSIYRSPDMFVLELYVCP